MPKDLSQSEYEALRDSIAENIRTMDQNELYLLFGISAVYFLVILDNSNNDTVVKIALWISFLLVFLAYLRFKGLDAVIGMTNSYLIEVENKSANIGWTSFYRDPKNRTSWMRLSRDVFWRLLILATFIMALFVQFCGIFWR